MFDAIERLFLSSGSRKLTSGRIGSFATIGASVESDFNIPATAVGLTTIEGIAASAWPTLSWTGFSVKGVLLDVPNNKGTIHIANGATSQAFDLSYIAVGK